MSETPAAWFKVGKYNTLIEEGRRVLLSTTAQPLLSSPSPSNFDPYDRWLGIPPGQQPADHYRLLGLALFESDPERIETAAKERIKRVEREQAGHQAEQAQRLMAELAAARDCLLSPEAKGAYDNQLRQKLFPAPLAKVVRSENALPEPPPIPPPARPPDFASMPADSADEPDENGIAEPAPPSLLRSLVMMAAAVLLIAAATFGIGRYFSEEAGHTPRGDRPGRSSAERKPVADSTVKPQAPSVRWEKIQPVVVLQEGSHDVNLTPLTARLSGEVRLKPLGGEEVLEQWTYPGDQAAWKFKLLRPGFFELELTYAALAEAGESRMAVFLDDRELHTFLLVPTGALDKWASRRHTVTLDSGGEHNLVLRLKDPVNSGCLAVKRVELSPAQPAEEGAGGDEERCR